jgi:hypothetical protein
LRNELFQFWRQRYIHKFLFELTMMAFYQK